jgi:hypothetical protein
MRKFLSWKSDFFAGGDYKNSFGEIGERLPNGGEKMVQFPTSGSGDIVGADFCHEDRGAETR